jgi:catechol 2,3-dioxygenase-like lactoylglutathione lyase family enzyme
MKSLLLNGRPAALAGVLAFAVALGGVATAQSSAPAQASPNLTGIAHVAIRVADLEKSREFFRHLGYEEAFAMNKGGSPTEAFFKINDRQFIELYPRHGGSEAVGFMHICFEAGDINAVYRDYVNHGLQPSAVKRAGAGNLLFTLQGPDEPPPVDGLRRTAAQNIEYTQYMPGSKHTLDRGQHLGPDRVADAIAGAGIPMQDVSAATAFYEQKLGFQRAAHPLEHGVAALSLPGTPDERVELLPPAGAADGNTALPFRIFFWVPNLKEAEAKLRTMNIPTQKRPAGLVIHDPDGNEMVFIVDKGAEAR